MKILVFNGSPKGERSNTLQLTKAFCAGITQVEQTQVEIVPVYQREIKDCRGCFHCWSATPGICCIQDDMAELISKILAADLIIWSFPLYYFGLPSRLKALMDRLLPMNLPFMLQDAQSGGFIAAAHAKAPVKVLIARSDGFEAVLFFLSSLQHPPQKPYPMYPVPHMRWSLSSE